MAKEVRKKTESTQARVPIVAILGHVDHGKTTLLDYIRKSNVQSCEAGGITQKISVFTISLEKKTQKKITFIDTPGHEAFDLMRTRGGSIADIVLLVVAANDGVKPQTLESIEIIKDSSVKPILVINKVDLPDINIQQVKRDVSDHGLLVEGMGGDIPIVEVSAKTGKGIPELLDLISLVVEVDGLKQRDALPQGVVAKGFVLESVKDKMKGNISSVVLEQGNLCKGAWLGFKIDDRYIVEKVKGIISEEGSNLCDLRCGCGGRIIGISQLLPLGSEIYILEEKDKDILESLYLDDKEKELPENLTIAEDEIFDSLFDENKDEGTQLNIILKSSSQGSLEAIHKSLDSIKQEEYSINVVSDGVGDIISRDVEMAKLSKAILLGFEVGVEKTAQEIAKKENVLIRTYSVIYKLVEEVEEALEMLSTPEVQEEEIGSANVRMIFLLSDNSKVIGSRVKEGVLKRDCKCYVVRNDEILAEGKIKSLRKGKDKATEVKQGEECGVILDVDVEAQEGDELYCYKALR